jgi:glycosyltransferase involved in cell wall biosynthesis
VPDGGADLEKHQTFLASGRKHVLMITNHGIHQWQVVPGLPDTGGQNVFVNQFTAALAQLGFKITIVNRGGYAHPVTGQLHAGLVYKDGHQRILYLDDGRAEFVRKEDMHEQIPTLVESLWRTLDGEGSEVDLLLSHYWDAAQIGAGYNAGRREPVKHVWVPHSLGTLKKRNVAPERWATLRIDERIAVERALVPQLDGVAATSAIIRQVLADDYGYAGPDLFLPPCVDTERYYPRPVAADHEVWAFLSRHSGLKAAEVRRCKIVTEISRTDTTKRKDLLIRAFARVQQRMPDSLLLVSIDEHQADLARELQALIGDLGVGDHVAVVGSVWEWLPALYAITDVYCTPSVMEGFGMSAQEAAATRVPMVASHLVPYVTGYLLGPDVRQVVFDPGHSPLQVGSGAIVVHADDEAGFAHALTMLLSDDRLRQEMGQRAYQITVPYFTWQNMVTLFITDLDIHPEPGRSSL